MQRLVLEHGDDMRFCAQWKKWLFWDGKRWGVDETGHVERFAKATVLTMKGEVDSIRDEGHGEELRRHCRHSQSVGSIKAMCELAKTDRKVIVTTQELDSDLFLLNCKNGTVDLKTGMLRKHKREDLLTMITLVEFCRTAECPTFERFLHRIMGGNAELVRFLQRCIGYCLTGAVTEKVFFMFLGEGDNGKTTLLEAVRFVLGEYAGQIPIASLLKKNDNGIPNDIAQLQGKRFVTSSEVPEGRAFDDSFMKYITGMGTLQARHLYGEYFEFTPTFKIFIDSNRKPRVAGNDKAMWSRIRVAPFNTTISEAEKDRNLLNKLKAEAPGILAWIVRGCLDWQNDGLRPPQAVTDATAEYHTEMDSVTRFLGARCDLAPGGKELSADLYAEYRKYCEEEGATPETNTTFGKLLGGINGLESCKIKDSRGWCGIRLRGERPLPLP